MKTNEQLEQELAALKEFANSQVDVNTNTLKALNLMAESLSEAQAKINLLQEQARWSHHTSKH